MPSGPGITGSRLRSLAETAPADTGMTATAATGETTPVAGVIPAAAGATAGAIRPFAAKALESMSALDTRGRSSTTSPLTGITHALASPTLESFVQRYRADHERAGGIGPPPTEERVQQQSDQ